MSCDGKIVQFGPLTLLDLNCLTSHFCFYRPPVVCLKLVCDIERHTFTRAVI